MKNIAPLHWQEWTNLLPLYKKYRSSLIHIDLPVVRGVYFQVASGTKDTYVPTSFIHNLITYTHGDGFFLNVGGRLQRPGKRGDWWIKNQDDSPEIYEATKQLAIDNPVLFKKDLHFGEYAYLSQVGIKKKINPNLFYDYYDLLSISIYLNRSEVEVMALFNKCLDLFKTNPRMYELVLGSEGGIPAAIKRLRDIIENPSLLSSVLEERLIARKFKNYDIHHMLP